MEGRQKGGHTDIQSEANHNIVVRQGRQTATTDNDIFLRVVGQ